MYRNIISVILLVRYFYILPVESAATKGPYSVEILQTKDCCETNETSYPIEKHGSYTVTHINTKTGSFLYGQLIVTKAIANFKVRIRSYVWEDTQWRIRLSLPAMNVRRPVVGFTIRALGIPYDTKNNTIPKMPLTQFQLDANIVQHMWDGREMMYGQYLWLVQLLVRRRSAFCLAVQTELKPV